VGVSLGGTLIKGVLMIKSNATKSNLFLSNLFFVGLGLVVPLCGTNISAKNGLSKQQENKQLINVEYDFTQQKENKNQMQLGTIALYFKQQPIVNELPQREQVGKQSSGLVRKNNQNKAVFFFPLAQVSPHMYPKIEKMLADNATDLFSVRLEKVMLPIPGLMLTIMHDAHKVSIQRVRQRSLDSDPGVAFHFYNKSLVQDLQIKDKEMLKITFDEHSFLSSKKGTLFVQA
jgi:hypothetical protein